MRRNSFSFLQNIFILKLQQLDILEPKRKGDRRIIILINCLAYIDLNPVRAGIAEKPEDYRWCSLLGYHVQTDNKENFLSTDFGLREFAVKSIAERLHIYRQFVYGKGELNRNDPETDEAFEIGAIEKFKYKTRYFTDSGIIGTKEFIVVNYQKFKDLFSSKHEKRPKTIQGMTGVYSLKRLSEKV